MLCIVYLSLISEVVLDSKAQRVCVCIYARCITVHYAMCNIVWKILLSFVCPYSFFVSKHILFTLEMQALSVRKCYPGDQVICVWPAYAMWHIRITYTSCHTSVCQPDFFIIHDNFRTVNDEPLWYSTGAYGFINKLCPC